jgi:hypothetical protein
MAAGTNQRAARTVGGLGGVLLAVAGALAAAGSRLPVAALLALLGLAVGYVLVAVGVVPPRRPRHSVVERLNDGAFVVVVVAVSLLLAITARPWTAVVPGLAGGVLGGLALWPGPDDRAGPDGPGDRDGGRPDAPGSSPGTGPSRSGPPAR